MRHRLASICAVVVALVPAPFAAQAEAPTTADESPPQPVPATAPSDPAGEPSESAAAANEPAVESSSTQAAVRYGLPDPDRGLPDYLIPVAVVPAVNGLYWSTGKFVLHEYFADISWQTMRGNIRHGWVYDDDIFAINQFGHPYQGNNYFAAARGAGLSFWESTPYVVGGSLMWEYLMESGPACCYPSVNDLVTTTVGGIAVGEVMWRLANILLDDSSSGGERAAREVGAFVVNPVYGLYRLTSGASFATGPAPLRDTEMWGEVSLGASLFGSGSAEDFAVIPRYRLRSGRLGELRMDSPPFEHFNLELALGISRKGVAGATFDVTALLAGWTFSIGEHNPAVVGLALDFDFFDNVLASLSQSGLGAMAAVEMPLGEELSFFSRLVLLGSFGAISTDYPDIRHYSVGPGATGRLWLELRHQQWGEVYVKVDRYWLYTVSGVPGEEVAGVLDAGGTVAVLPQLGVGFHYLLADKSGFYVAKADTSEVIHLGEAYVAWRF